MKEITAPLKEAVTYRRYKGLVLMISDISGELLHTYSKSYYEQEIKRKAESSLLERVKTKMAVNT
jgi:hypothetical protein